MPSRKTKAEIVSTALKLVGNAAADLQTEGELWLDLLLDDAARNYRFPELQRQHSASVAAGLSTVLTPTDYGFLVKDGNQRGAVGYLAVGSSRTAVFERLASELRIPDANGQCVVADDRYNAAWLAYMPSNGGQLYLEYQAIPLAVASDAVVWYPADLELVQQVKFLAEMYMRGSLLNLAAQIKEAGRVLSLRSPARTKLFTSGGPGSDLDPRWFS
jgi:hypothetical protein